VAKEVTTDHSSEAGQGDCPGDPHAIRDPRSTERTSLTREETKKGDGKIEKGQKL